MTPINTDNFVLNSYKIKLHFLIFVTFFFNDFFFFKWLKMLMKSFRGTKKCDVVIKNEIINIY